MAKLVLDTTFLIDLLRGQKPAMIAAQELEGSGSEVYTTAINCYELLLGARRLRKVAETEALLADLAVLALTKEAASEAANLQDSLASRGETLDHRDALMLGIALAHGIKSVMSNDEDLRRVREIQVRSY
ncbi:MAG: type II toxin-antitoxin system VapC family toxin [Candidatus Bathyarchaeia archaeon]